MSVVQIIVESGPHRGDSISLPQGTCRLIGRHLSEGETMLTDGPDLRFVETDLPTLAAQQRSRVQPQSTLSSKRMARGPDIILSDQAVSRAHAMLFYDDNYVGVMDLGSTNGTYLNDSLCSEARLQNGDVLILGESRLRITL